MDENISRAAGADHGQGMDDGRLRAARRAPRAHASNSAPRSTAGSRPCPREPSTPLPAALPYRIDAPTRIATPCRDLVSRSRGGHRADADLVFEMVVTALRIGREGRPTGASSSWSTPPSRSCATRSSSSSPTGDIRKVSIFGSARTAGRVPSTRWPAAFGDRRWPTPDWMVITGAGPGHHGRPGIEGAGPRPSFGVGHPASPSKTPPRSSTATPS